MALYRCEKNTKIFKKLLWNNPSPTTAFPAQTLSFDLSKYDAVIIRCSWQTNYNTDTQKRYQLFNYVPKDGAEHTISSCLGTSGSSLSANRRQATVTDSGITFSAGWAGGSDNNNVIIPIEIYGYVYEPDIAEPDKRKFILKDGLFQGTRGIDYGVLGTVTYNPGSVTMSGSAYAFGIAPFISASDKTKYKRVVFDADTGGTGTSKLSYSTTETGSRTDIANSANTWAVNINTLNNDIFLYYLCNLTSRTFYNIYLE